MQPRWSPGSPGPPGHPPPPPKRRKVQLACTKCRNRKTRCDGNRPACIACTDRGIAAECVYEANVPTSQRPVDQAELLHRKSLNAAAQSPEEHATGVDGNHMTQSSHDARSVAASNDSFYPPSVHSIGGYNQVDGLATVAFPREDQNLYGESSTIAFVRHVMHEKPRPPDLWQAAAQELEPIRDRDESLAIYPRRQAADDYISSFWEFVHPVFPILHETSFMRKYVEVWSSQPSEVPNDLNSADEAAFSASLNLTFALGCQFSRLVPANKRMAVADEFYQRARKIFIYDVLDTSSIPVLQMLLLTGVYLQSTKYSERCWNTVGLAIRAAQTLGLHSESTRRSEAQLSREIRRRVWHVCVTLDRLLAMTFGRPAMITRSWDTPCPLMIDDEYLRVDSDGQQPQDIPSRMGLFVYSSRLYDILDKILVSLYTNPESESSSATSANDNLQKLLGSILTYNRQLDSLYSSIPDYLLLSATRLRPNGGADNSNIQLQAQILNCRFLYTRVILLRPLLLLSTQGSIPREGSKPSLWQTLTLDRELADNICILCVKTARELVDSLCQNIDTPYRISPWHTVYLSFAVAIVLIAAQRCPAIAPVTNPDTLDAPLAQCMTILTHYEPQIHSACQAKYVLQKLYNQLRTSTSQNAAAYAVGRRDPHSQTVIANESVPMNTEAVPNMEPSQEWWDEVLPNRSDLQLESWYSQHILNLDWLELS